MGTPHKHAASIKAWADGAKIQYLLPGYEHQGWRDAINPSWQEDCQYRVKPPKPESVLVTFSDCSFEVELHRTTKGAFFVTATFVRLE